ncbi:hypothetical protein K239x_01090 [Planctomycetes bacterium K23_9]|uniref:Uncharacterized protein n=1 Tax=Stieleria marina TaxID=1930275 RepID=A0A517NM19_9BACT|nr:hypothetical protein K239x_01090 [Planctomycetes bacterium K23_9]
MAVALNAAYLGVWTSWQDPTLCRRRRGAKFLVTEPDANYRGHFLPRLQQNVFARTNFRSDVGAWDSDRQDEKGPKSRS